jgi:hypothetical protein
LGCLPNQEYPSTAFFTTSATSACTPLCVSVLGIAMDMGIQLQAG